MLLLNTVYAAISPKGSLEGTGICDNGIIEGDEECDPPILTEDIPTSESLGYEENQTYCDENCKNETIYGPYCGDTIINGPEECDCGEDGCIDEELNGFEGCNVDCTGIENCECTEDNDCNSDEYCDCICKDYECMDDDDCHSDEECKNHVCIDDDDDNDDELDTIVPNFECYFSTQVCLAINANTNADYNINFENKTISGTTPDSKEISYETLEDDLTLHGNVEMTAHGYEDWNNYVEIECEPYHQEFDNSRCYNIGGVTCDNENLIYRFGINEHESSADELTIESSCGTVETISSDDEYSKKLTIPFEEITEECSIFISNNDCLCNNYELDKKPINELSELNCRSNHFRVNIECLTCTDMKICSYDGLTNAPLENTRIELDIEYIHGTDSNNTLYTVTTEDEGCIEFNFPVSESFVESEDSGIEVKFIASNEDYSGFDDYSDLDHGSQIMTNCSSFEKTCFGENYNETETNQTNTNQTNNNQTNNGGMNSQNNTGNQTQLMIGCMIGDCDEQLKGKEYDLLNWDMELRSGCAGLFTIIINDNFVICDILWIILVAFSIYDGMRMHSRNKRKAKHDPINPFEKFLPGATFAIPILVGLLTFAWIGILIALLFMGIIVFRIENEYKQKPKKNNVNVSKPKTNNVNASKPKTIKNTTAKKSINTKRKPHKTKTMNNKGGKK